MKLLGMLKTALIAAIFCAAATAGDAGLSSFVVTNDDGAVANSATFFAVNADGTLGATTIVKTGGIGIGGGFFAAKRVIILPNGAADACVFVSDAGTGDIAGIDASTHAVTGNFQGSSTDSGMSNGIGLDANAQYLYATYSASTTIATFQMQAGCTLSFVSDVFAAGLNGGTVDGMAVHGNMMVVTYGDGSIESFNTSAGVPVSNGDQQYSTGSVDDHLPNSVIITRDGHYAIFGDASTRTTVEVSDISSGKLTPSIAYSLGPAWNSGSISLSADEKLLYVSNTSGAQVTVAFFDNTTGVVRQGCTSSTLAGYYSKFVYAGNIRLQNATGHGGMIYVPEFGTGGKSFIALLQLTVSGSTCTVAEAPGSPVTGPARGATVLSIAAYPTGLPF